MLGPASVSGSGRSERKQGFYQTAGLIVVTFDNFASVNFGEGKKLECKGEIFGLM